MSEETELYEGFLKRVNKVMMISGCYIDEADHNRNVLNRFMSRKLYCFNIFMLTTHLLGDFAWLAYEYKTASLLKLTYFIPCVTLSLLTCARSYFFIKNGDKVIDLIQSIKHLQDVSRRSQVRKETEREVERRAMLVSVFIHVNSIFYILGLALFAVGPLVVTWVLYKSSGKLEMQVPFLSKYPFDETDIRYWPMAYAHQMWAGFIDVSVELGSNSFYSLSCTFLHIQFKTLQYDITRILPEGINMNTEEAYAEFRKSLAPIIMRHKELIRCVSIVEMIYSKTNLCTIAVSSIIICVSAFNLTTDIFFMWRPIFFAFLIVWLLQVFSLCYYSNLLDFSSTEISDAVYNSAWYKANTRIMKDLLFILTRVQKPCKLTAWGFSELNLRVFSKILSSSWSYFALLQTMNKDLK